MRKTGIPSFFAFCVMRPAAARTCETVPAAESESVVWMVWMESTMAHAGFSFSIVAAIFSAMVSSEKRMFSFFKSSLLSRLATCDPDSSPEIYSTGAVLVASAFAICNMSVDFPIPGSPASSMIAPATIPPPSTRSISSMLVLVLDVSFELMCSSDSVLAGEPETVFFCTAATTAEFSSTIVPHLLHSKHCPVHF